MNKESLLEKMEKKLALQHKQEELDKTLKDARRLQLIENERANLTKRSNDRKILQHGYIEHKELEEMKKMDREMERKQNEGSKRYATDEKLAKEMDLIKQDEIREIKLRQQLRENDPDLREFQRQLRQAYAAKELAFQIAQNKADKLEEKVREKQANDAFNMLRANDIDFDIQQHKEDAIKKAEYLQILQNQMLSKEREKKIEFENYLIEKKIIDDTTRRIRDEDESFICKKMQDIKRTQEEMKQFEAARETWRQMEIERMKEENENIEKYLTAQKAAQKKSDDEKRLKEEAKDKIVQKISKMIHDKEVEREERNVLLLELKEEEAKEADIQHARAEMEKKFRARLQLSAALEQQIKEKDERLKKECENDYKYRQQLMDKIMEEERIHQMTEQKRRRKMIEVRQTVEKMMLERHEQRAAEIQKLWRLKEIEKENEDIRKQRVECERIQLLKEHCNNLIGFLPSGVLKEDDFQHLDDDIVKRIKALSVKAPCP